MGEPFNSEDSPFVTSALIRRREQPFTERQSTLEGRLSEVNIFRSDGSSPTTIPEGIVTDSEERISAFSALFQDLLQREPPITRREPLIARREALITRREALITRRQPPITRREASDSDDDVVVGCVVPVIPPSAIRPSAIFNFSDDEDDDVVVQPRVRVPPIRSPDISPVAQRRSNSNNQAIKKKPSFHVKKRTPRDPLNPFY